MGRDCPEDADAHLAAEEGKRRSGRVKASQDEKDDTDWLDELGAAAVEQSA
jgi:hypothetical protein